MTGPEDSVMNAINHLGSWSSGMLFGKLHVTNGNITGMVERLEKKGRVVRERQREDRRGGLLLLKHEGQKRAEELPDPAEIKIIAGLAELHPEEMEAIDKAMAAVFDIVGADVEATDDWGADSGKSSAP
ncbi:hypothetical protein DQK91_22945 [Oceanidesulfovibrio marinus]|uniref:HTH marR-type domain-containing protein n=2 Tax=Oceanidesulfovibrio marinus TaxID=370038 RepID=A0A6P1Z920_9BACT|nr:hypothetical protein DQK91_22945 [Oceanidesulfovibrio marinus]